MSNRTFTVLIGLLLLLQLPAGAQTEIVFREGLAIANCHQYGRQATFTDQFAWRYFAPGYQTPKSGAALFTDAKGEPVSWKETRADSSGRFTGREAANGYIYLTYRSDRERGGIINITGNAMFYWNGEPHPGDPYDHKYLHIPVKIRKGLNELYIRTSGSMRQGVIARLALPAVPVSINTLDPTVPHIVPGKDNSSLMGAVVILNTSGKPLQDLLLRSGLKGREITETVPPILPYSSRKVAFRFNGSGITGKGSEDCELTLLLKDQVIARSVVKIESVAAGEPYSCTFISQMDGSVQYYAVNPQSGTNKTSPALFLSVHGAGVEAIGQARAYQPKDWGTLVAPTNRRPRGFNWEDWGRIDALEVLDIAVDQFHPDPSKIYLTGHSMGGHGTWYLGTTYPGKWAAIAPCAGYASLMAYASADGKIPQPGDNKAEQDLYRASNGSNVPALARNLGAAGVYVHHGDDDRTVSVDYARQMRRILGSFHPDFAYYEYPGGSHWWSNESVDWPPLFDFFRLHSIKPDSLVNRIDFATANPAVSSSCRWVSILQQTEPLNYSTIQIQRDPANGVFTGQTLNIAAVKLDLTGIRSDSVLIRLDGDAVRLATPRSGHSVCLRKGDRWAVASEPGHTQKGTVRNGTFKEPFNHRMVFVFGTTGTKQENEWALSKAKYDAETWYYRGNGAVDLMTDAQFDPAKYAGRGVILYGNATTNSAWAKVLSVCPIQVQRGSITIGGKTLEGDGYGAYIAYPRSDSPIASIAAITGTGLPGMHAADANQYFSGGSGFPDYLIFTADMAKDGARAILYSGFFTNNWLLETSGAGEKDKALRDARYAPEGMYMKDHYLFRDQGTWHLFAPLGPIGTMWHYEGSEESAEHMVSSDLINWNHVGTAVPASKKEGYFDRTMGGIAPCIVRDGDTFYMIYSGWDFKSKNPRNLEGFRQGIGIAVSKDLRHWEKPEAWAKDGLEPKGSDPFVVRDEEHGRWLLFAARDNAVAAYEGRDLFRWREAGFTLTRDDLRVGMTGMNPGESPFIMKHPISRRWMIFMNGGYSVSDDPLDFPPIIPYPFQSGIYTFPNPHDEGKGTYYHADDDGAGFAHEIIEFRGRWYMTGAVGVDGHTKLKLTPIEWTAESFKLAE